jgi:preprotein translocase subunit SecA
MPGRRWSDGLHQAVEAKEKSGLKTRIRLGNDHLPELFPHVQKLAGMTEQQILKQPNSKRSTTSM